MARTFYQIIIITCALISFSCDRDSKKNKSPSASVNELATGETPTGSCHLSLTPDSSPLLKSENWLEDWTKPQTKEFCDTQWKNLIAGNPATQKTVYNFQSSWSKDALLYRIVDIVDVSNDDSLHIDTETVIAQLTPVYAEGSIGGRPIEIKKSDFIGSCASNGLDGIQHTLEFIPSINGIFRYYAGWRHLTSWDKTPDLVTNHIDSVTVPAGTFSSRYFKFQAKETEKGIPVNRVLQMWLSGSGINERIIKIREHVELLTGEEISWELSELTFCGWQQASDL